VARKLGYLAKDHEIPGYSLQHGLGEGDDGGVRLDHDKHKTALGQSGKGAQLHCSQIPTAHLKQFLTMDEKVVKYVLSSGFERFEKGIDQKERM
jgi:hypothetical protein